MYNARGHQQMDIFVTGGTGYMGQRLISELLEHGHVVSALVRSGSERKLPPGCRVIIGDALKSSTYQEGIPPTSTFVQLVGVSHPGPAKANQFRSIDLVSGLEAVSAAQAAMASHFVYVSVAQPAPVMKAYVEVRAEVEARILSSGLNATILRPWYVLGPGHRWPLLLLPLYWVLGSLSATRAGMERFGLVTLKQMVQALMEAIESPGQGVRIWEVPRIKQA